jgi:hypothetical protein
MPLFQHRHHCALANALALSSANGRSVDRDNVIRDLTDMLQRDNPRFDRHRFIAAAGGEPEAKDARTIKHQAPTVRIWWVATYGNGQIVVSHYFTADDYVTALTRADRDQQAHRCDAYTGSWVEASYGQA